MYLQGNKYEIHAKTIVSLSNSWKCMPVALEVLCRLSAWEWVGQGSSCCDQLPRPCLLRKHPSPTYQGLLPVASLESPSAAASSPAP